MELLLLINGMLLKDNTSKIYHGNNRDLDRMTGSAGVKITISEKVGPLPP